MPIQLLVASPDERFRETIRDSLVNIDGAKVISEYPEVASNLYIRVLQDLERHPEAALIADLSGDPEASLKAIEKVTQAAPDLYVIASNFHADGDTVLSSVRSGCRDFLVQPVKRLEFREAMTRLERTPRHATTGGSRLGKVYAFLGATGGAGTTTLAVNFAGVLAQRKKQTVLVDLDFTANDCAMQTGASPQHSLLDVADNLARLDAALFEGLTVRDPLGFHLIGPPAEMEQRLAFTEPMFREFASFLVEKYEAIVIDAGRWISDEVVLAALQSSSSIFLTITQQFPSIRNAQRYIGALTPPRLQSGADPDRRQRISEEAVGQSRHARTDQADAQSCRSSTACPSSPAALAAVNRGRPFVADRQAAGDLDRAFRAFVDKATGAKQQPQTLAATA